MHEGYAVFFLGLGLLLGAARFLGELARRFHQPAVLGEIAAGILLGPTVLGAFAPGLSAFLFPAEGSLGVAMDALMTLSITLFLLVAGMEVDLSLAWRQGRSAVAVGLGGLIVPFGIAYLAGWLWPVFLGAHEVSGRVFPLFFATAMSISALPVIAKILIDLKMYRTDLGMIITAAAMLNDLVGWIVFAVIIGMVADAAPGVSVAMTIFLTVGFAATLLTAGRLAIDRVLPFIQAHASWPGGVIGFALAGALVCAALTEAIGIHAVFGAFLFGVALGDSVHLKERTRSTIDQFVSFVFAPLFFASIGLRVDFARHFDPALTAAVLAIAVAGKLIGCRIGGGWSGLPRREIWAVGFAMNARGAMEIILGLLALRYRVIEERMFVALVVMALVTSMAGGVMIERVLKRRRPVRFVDVLHAKGFVSPLRATDFSGTVEELSRVLSQAAGLPPGDVFRAVWERERTMSTAVGLGLAIPHARWPGLKNTVAAVGISDRGYDADAPDGVPVRLILLVLSPAGDDDQQLDLLVDIAKTFSTRERVQGALACRHLIEFRAFVNSLGDPAKD
ncbi:MAG: cation:proton antiporter [Deltaproteobacteria bacterium]|nr:cation:proton antiporter [Deltaproteobacteria bacterium]